MFVLCADPCPYRPRGEDVLAVCKAVASTTASPEPSGDSIAVVTHQFALSTAGSDMFT